MRISILAILWTPVLALAADASSAAIPSNYANSVQQWRTERETALRADNGWLTVVGLTWLKNGESTIGSNPSSGVVLPKAAPERVGTLTRTNGKVVFKPAVFQSRSITVAAGPGSGGVPLTREIELHPDVDAKYTRVMVGRITFFIIRREEKFGVRIKDNDSPARREFSGMKWYPVDPSWRVTAQYVPFDKPRELTFETIAGVKEKDETPGYVRFTREGKEYRMDAVVEDKELWFILRDATSGKSTYSAARFLYAAMPRTGLKRAGPVVLDFNKAENPPCVFTPYATCPLPPPQNRLTLAVTAGEQMYGHPH